MSKIVCFSGIFKREILRFLQQRSRLFSALVRPLLWLFVFAAGFRNALGLSIMEPYHSYILYEEYIIPGLACMIVLFNSMQSSLSMVYDREMGSMKVLLMSPFSKPFLLLSRLTANACISVLQVAVFFACALLVDVKLSLVGYVMSLLVIFLAGLLLGALGVLLAGHIKQLENFAGTMNFVIFPMFFMSTALYPLYKIQESSDILYHLCRNNPFTLAVESVRFAMYEQWASLPLAILAGLTTLLCVLASRNFNTKP